MDGMSLDAKTYFALKVVKFNLNVYEIVACV